MTEKHVEGSLNKVCMHVCICLLSLRDSEVEGVPTKILARANLKRVECYSLYYRNRPFYRYGSHIELIRFKEYYRMPRGHDHISFVFSSAFRDIFS